MREFKERKKPSQSSDAFFKPTVQTKLSVGQAGDQYEQEADAMAEKIVNGSSESTKNNNTGEKQKTEKTAIPAEAEKVLPEEVKNAVKSKEDASESLQKKDDEEQQKIQQKEQDKETIQSKEEDSASVDEEQKIQKKEEESDVIQPKEEQQDMSQIQASATEMQKTMGENKSTSPEQASLENRLKQGKGQGSPLNKEVKAEMENGFGTDFSDVRIHTDKEAQQMTSEMRAQAFTYGNDIYFNSGKYNPKSNEGKLLLAHELSHVLQQRRAPQLNLVQRHTVEDCNNEYYNILIPACNRLKTKAERAICFAAAAATYGACLASADEVMAGILLTVAIIAAAILILADGPLPFGDAAAAAILLSVGIKL